MQGNVYAASGATGGDGGHFFCCERPSGWHGNDYLLG